MDLQEYYLDFKTTSIFKGQGLCKLMIEGQNNEESSWDNEAELHMVDVCPLFTTTDSWYRDLVHYLQEGYLSDHWSPKQRRALRLK